LIGGVILAAGAGRRFGGAKQLAQLDGRPLLEHAIDATLRVREIDRVVVVLGAYADQIRTQVDFQAAEPVICWEWQEGLAASLRTGVAELLEAEAVVVLLGDQPAITPQVIAAALDQASAGHHAVRATYAGQPGHPVIVPRPVFANVALLRGDTGARDLLANLGVREWECGHLCRADDVDTPEQLAALQQVWRANRLAEPHGLRSSVRKSNQ
jgi:CTP:molybdopterin cytidylyltransferase MocA